MFTYIWSGFVGISGSIFSSSTHQCQPVHFISVMKGDQPLHCQRSVFSSGKERGDLPRDFRDLIHFVWKL